MTPPDEHRDRGGGNFGHRRDRGVAEHRQQREALLVRVRDGRVLQRPSEVGETIDAEAGHGRRHEHGGRSGPRREDAAVPRRRQGNRDKDAQLRLQRHQRQHDARRHRAVAAQQPPAADHDEDHGGRHLAVGERDHGRKEAEHGAAVRDARQPVRGGDQRDGGEQAADQQQHPGQRCLRCRESRQRRGKPGQVRRVHVRGIAWLPLQHVPQRAEHKAAVVDARPAVGATDLGGGVVDQEVVGEVTRRDRRQPEPEVADRELHTRHRDRDPADAVPVPRPHWRGPLSG